MSSTIDVDQALSDTDFLFIDRQKDALRSRAAGVIGGSDCARVRFCEVTLRRISRLRDESPSRASRTLTTLTFSPLQPGVPDRMKQERGLRLILEQPSRGRIFVYRWNDAIVGMVNLLFTISTAEGGFVVLLEDVIVRVDYRGRGVGQQLLSHVIEYAKKKEFLRITLLTDRINEEGPSANTRSISRP